MMTTPDDNRYLEVEANATQILNYLSSLSARAKLLVLAGGLGWTVAGTAVLLLALVTALGWWGGTGIRILGWTAVVTGFVALLVLTVIRPMLRLLKIEAVAHRIGDTFPKLASDVLSASQLAKTYKESPFSQGLITCHIRSVLDALNRIPRGKIYSPSILLWPLLAFACAFGVTLATHAGAPELIETGLSSLWKEPKLPPTTGRVIEAKAPVISDLSLTLRYPEYLRRKERHLEAISGGVVAPLGTTVLLDGKSLVKGANLGMVNLPEGHQIKLSINGQGRVQGRFVVGAAGPFSLSLGTKTLMVEGPERHLDVEIDAPPTIRLLTPTRDVEIDEGAAVVLEIEAEDDHGLDKIELVVRAGANLEQRKTIIQIADKVKRIRTQYRWSPSTLRMGDQTNVQLELEAYDDDTILGPKPGRAEPLGVRILTPMSKHRGALEKQNETLDSLVDLLAGRLNTSPFNNKYPQKAIERFTVLRRQTEDVLGQAARLIPVLRSDSMTPRRVVDAFVQIREDLSNQLLHEARLHQRQIGDFQKRKSVDRVTSRLLEKAIIGVDDLIIEQQLGRLLGTGSTLDTAQGQLGELLSKFDRTRTESSRRAVMDAIAQMENVVRQLQQSLEQVRGKVDDTFINPSSKTQMDLLGSLDRIRALLADGDVQAATELVARLESDIGRLMAGMESGLLSFRTERFGEGERFMGELLDRVIAIEAGQLQLRRETIALQRRYQERLVEEMRGRIDPLVKRQLMRVKNIRTATEELGLPDSSVRKDVLVAVRVNTRELALALGQGDLDEARSGAREIAELAEDLGGEPSEVKKLKRAAKMIVDELTDAFPKPGQLFSDRDKRLLRADSVKQRHLVFRIKRLRKWISGQGEETRFLSSRARSSLRVVARNMEDAVTKLEGKQVRSAMAEQSAALDELAKLREDLKRGDEVAQVESRPIVLRSQVELTDPDEYEVPPQFREDILEAMGQDLPDQYQDAIKRYYETLVQ